MDAQQKNRYSRQILFANNRRIRPTTPPRFHRRPSRLRRHRHRRSQSPNPRRPRLPPHHRSRFRRALQSPTPNSLRRIRRPGKSPESRSRRAPPPRHKFPSANRSRSSRSNPKKRPRPCSSQFPRNSRRHRQFRNAPANQRRRHRPQHPVDLRRSRSQQRRNNDDHPRRNRLPGLPTRIKRATTLKLSRHQERRTCDTAGILNSAINAIAAIESTEAIKLLIGQRAIVAPAPNLPRRLDQSNIAPSAVARNPQLPRLRPTQFPLPRRRRPTAHHPMRPRQRPNPRARLAVSISQRCIKPLANTATEVRSNNYLLRFRSKFLRTNRLPRRPRHHQRHKRPSRSPHALRPLHRRVIFCEFPPAESRRHCEIQFTRIVSSPPGASLDRIDRALRSDRWGIEIGSMGHRDRIDGASRWDRWGIEIGSMGHRDGIDEASRSDRWGIEIGSMGHRDGIDGASRSDRWRIETFRSEYEVVERPKRWLASNFGRPQGGQGIISPSSAKSSR